MRPPYTEKRRQLFAGVSVYSDREVARAQALRLKPPRPYLAVLQVTPNAAMTSEQTGKRPEHYTLWAIPKDLKGCVVSVVEIATGSTLGAVFSTSE
jgi:hypothetical protein